MPTYRKRPVVIQARQFESTSFDHMQDLVRWMGQGRGWHNGKVIFIETKEGRMEASEGDWIICGVIGEFYPCKPDVFALTYEPV